MGLVIDNNILAKIWLVEYYNTKHYWAIWRIDYNIQTSSEQQCWACCINVVSLLSSMSLTKLLYNVFWVSPSRENVRIVHRVVALNWSTYWQWECSGCLCFVLIGLQRFCAGRVAKVSCCSLREKTWQLCLTKHRLSECVKVCMNGHPRVSRTALCQWTKLL